MINNGFTWRFTDNCACFSFKYRKIPKFLDAIKLGFNLHKIRKKRGQTLGYFVKKLQME